MNYKNDHHSCAYISNNICEENYKITSLQIFFKQHDLYIYIYTKLK